MKVRDRGILIVSDNKPVGIVLRKMFREIFPRNICTIHVANNPSQAFGLLESFVYCVVICDLDLDDFVYTGIEVLTKAKLQSSVATILMSGDFFAPSIIMRLGMDGKAAGIIAGVDGFWEKPLTMEKIKEAIPMFLDT